MAFRVKLYGRFPTDAPQLNENSEIIPACLKFQTPRFSEKWPYTYRESKILCGVYGNEWQSEVSLSRMYEATGSLDDQERQALYHV